MTTYTNRDASARCGVCHAAIAVGDEAVADRAIAPFHAACVERVNAALRNLGCAPKAEGAPRAFDFGIARVACIRPGTPAAVHWSWAIRFRDGRAFHVVRRSGALREWR